jgi:hypothetical protein
MGGVILLGDKMVRKLLSSFSVIAMMQSAKNLLCFSFGWSFGEHYLDRLFIIFVTQAQLQLFFRAISARF